MERREEAIALVLKRGCQAFEWDTYAPGAFGVATRSQWSEDMGDRLLGKLVVFRPSGSSWLIEGVPVMGLPTVKSPEAHSSLADAVASALRFVCEGDDLDRGIA